METSGAKVMILCADIAREEQMREVFTRAEKHFGKINGIIHAAGVADYGGVIQRRTPETTAGILAPKVKGTLILDRLLKERNMKVDFFVLFSSVSTILAPFGECAYVAANAFLDAFAHYKNHREEEFTISINWGTWQEVGMSVEAVKRYTQQKNLDIGNLETFLANGISPLEGIDAFNRIMQVKLSQVVVFPEDLYLAMQRRNIPDTSITREESENETPPGFLAQRPQLSNEYVPPENSIEQIFGDILGNFLQVELVGVNDNFFELGLNSLDMVQVNNKLKQAIDRNIPVALWFEYPTIRSLAQHLEQKESEENDTLAAVERTAALDKGKNKLKQLKQRSRVINE
jgi:acyl carrier protein